MVKSVVKNLQMIKNSLLLFLISGESLQDKQVKWLIIGKV